MTALRLERLTLSRFRNYEALDWLPGARLVVIAGANGSGKTNLLEAVSLLATGRGLRGAATAMLARHGRGPWAVAARLAVDGANFEVATGADPEPPHERRVFRLDGVAPRNQAEIAGRVAAVWITPQMERLFGEAASGRRRFLDRLAAAVEPAHARALAAWETAAASRRRVLAEAGDLAWLAGFEEAMARHAVAVTAGRMALVRDLGAALAGGAAAPFPAVHLVLECAIATRLRSEPALSVEEWLRGALADGRKLDHATGSAAVGAHRADFRIEDAASGLDAAMASTGEQKAMLMGIVLGHAAVVTRARGFSPLLLLDEPLVHLDDGRRAALFATLGRLDAQVLMTGTQANEFRPLAGLAALFSCQAGGLAEQALPTSGQPA
ncbi:MAG: DNA replication/repair protein RecF [Rhodospirillales bacterium]|nr:DNA replication/repair protein RecF [Rhodospirillales bacterium]